MMRKFCTVVLSVLLALDANAATFSLFSPATGVLKGNSSTYVTSAATSTDIVGLWSGVCTGTNYLGADGACHSAATGTVTSVALTAPSIFSVSGSPVTTSGTLAFAYSGAQGDLIYASGATTLAALAKNTSATRYLSNTGASNNPAWAQIDLTNGVTGILPAANGGNGNGFFAVSGPLTSTKTFTFPNASATVLTTNAAVTVAQGGTGAATLTGVLKGNGTSAFTAATSSDVIGLWTGTCNSTTFLRADGSCQAASGGSPGGATNGDIQYKSGSSFAASDNFSYTESLDAGGSYFPSILQLGSNTTEGALFGTGSITVSAFANKVTSGATYFDYFNSGYLQVTPSNGTDGGVAILQSGNAPSAGDGGSLTIEAGDAAGTNHNGGGVLIESGAKTGSGAVGVITIRTGGGSMTGGGQMAFTQGLVVGSPTGGDKGAGTVNATGLYVNGSAVAGSFSGAGVHSGGSTSCGVGSYCAIAYNTEDYDTGSFHDTVTNNSRILLPNSTGFAQCAATVTIITGTTSASSIHAMEVIIAVNGPPGGGGGTTYGQESQNFFITSAGSTFVTTMTATTGPIPTSNGTDYAQAYFDTQGFATSGSATTNSAAGPNRFWCWAVK